MPRAVDLGPRSGAVLAALAVALLIIACAAMSGVQAFEAARTSAWLDHVITIDGSDSDWAGLMTPVKDSHLALGFANDDDWLYVCVQAKHEPTRLQLAAAGVIVWLDAAKGAENVFGIRFPNAGSTSVLGEPPAAQPAGWPAKIDVLGPGKKKSRTVPIDEAGGIQVRCAMPADVFVCELKVPLRPGGDHPYGIGVEPGQRIRAAIETPEYRGPYPRSPYVPGGYFGVAAGPATVSGGLGIGLPATGVPVVPRPVSLQTTVLLAARETKDRDTESRSPSWR